MAELDDWITPKDEADDWIVPDEGAQAPQAGPPSVSVQLSPDRLARKSLAPAVPLPQPRPASAPQADPWLAQRAPVPFTDQAPPIAAGAPAAGEDIGPGLSPSDVPAAPDTVAPPMADVSRFLPGYQPQQPGAAPAQMPPPEDGRGIAARVADNALPALQESVLDMPRADREKYPRLAAVLDFLKTNPQIAGMDAAFRAPGVAIGAGSGLAAGLAERFGLSRAEADRLQRDLNILGQGAMIETGNAPHGALPETAVRSTRGQVEDFLGTAEGLRSRAEIDEFLRQKEAAERPIPGQQALPAPEQAGEPASAPSARAPGVVTSDEAIPQQNQQAPGRVVTSGDPEAATLRAYGYTDEQIQSMTPAQRAAEVRDAIEAGVKPEEGAGKSQDFPNLPDENSGKLSGKSAAENAAASTALPDDLIYPGTRDAPVDITSGHDVETAAGAINQDHTPAQGEANNIQRGHATWQGFGVTFEAPAGGIRRGVAPDGTPFEQSFTHAYGYFKGIKGADGDNLDVYFGKHPDTATEAYVLNEKDPKTGRFRQTKSFVGMNTEDEVRAAYLGTQGKTAEGIRNIVPMPVDDFKGWLQNGDHSKPVPAPKTVNVKPRSKPAGPQSLLQFIAARGGIDPRDPLIADVRQVIGGRNKMIPGYGPLIRKGGKFLDNHREAAVESGYLRDTPYSGGTATTTPSDIIDLIGEENGGRKTFPEGSELTQSDQQDRYQEGEERLAAHRTEVTESLAEYGITDARPEDVHRAAAIMATEGLDPTDAYDKAMAEAIRDEELLTEPQQDTLGIKDDFDAFALDELNQEGGRAPVAGERADGAGRQGAEDAALREPSGENGDRQGQEAQAGTERPVEPEPNAQGHEQLHGDGEVDTGAREGGSEPERRPEGARNQNPTSGNGGHQVEATPAGEQSVIPGAEKVNGADLAQHQAEKPLRPKVNQKPADEGLFGDSAAQTDLVDMARKPEQPVEWSKAQPGDLLANGSRLVRKGINTRASAKITAEGVYRGEVILDGATKFAVIQWTDEKSPSVPVRPEGLSELPEGFKVRARKQTNGGETYSLYQKGKGYVGTFPTEAEAIAAANSGANLSPDEVPNGRLPVSVHAGDARPGAGDVQKPEPVRPVGESSRAGVEAGGAPGAPTPEGGTEGQGRPPVAAGDEGGRGESPSSTAGVSVGDDGRGGRDGGASRNPAAGVVGENFSIASGALDEGRSFKTKAIDNVRAIELARQIKAEDRPATRAEQEELARYVGWGGIKGAFPDADGNFGKGFEEIGAKLKSLLSESEYTTARRSIQYAHYTAENVVRAMWKAAERLGFKNGEVFEPGMGVGNFAGMMPPDVAAATHYVGLELDHTTADIAKLLYPKWGVKQGDFTRSPLPENTFDLVIGNPPFADVVIKSDPKYAKHGFYLHDYFFAKSLDAVRPGGVLAFISSAGTMNKIDPAARNYLADRADLVGAIRLPGNAFKKNAGTEVTTDIVILRKRLPDEAPGDRSWTETVDKELPGPTGEPVTGAVNRYFAEHPEMVLGEQGFFDKLYEGRYAVRAPSQVAAASREAWLDAALAKAVDALPADVMKPWEQTFAPTEYDFSTAEKKEGTFYIGPNGKLMQVSSGAGREVERRGKGVEGGKTQDQIDRVVGLIPVRDALRAVYAADLAGDLAGADKARAKLNSTYDGFVRRFGPINKDESLKRRPTSIQEESARSEAREEARYAGLLFDEGTFDATDLYKNGATKMEVARARKEAREAAERAGTPFEEGDFDPADMADVIIERRPNIDPFMDDQESYRLRAIEKYDDATGKAEKSKVFTENVVSKPRAPEIKSVNDAVLHVLNQRGRLDIGEVAALVNKTESEAIEALGDSVYRDPEADHVWTTRDDYLSGNVRKKLALAKAAAERDPDLRRNVAALEAVQPVPLGPSQIHATLGMPWIPPETIRNFGYQALGLDSLKVRYVPSLAQWIVSGDTDSAAAMTTWGTDRRRAPALLSDALNRQTPKIYDTIKTADGTTTVLNVDATTAAQEKVKAIQEKFADWIWSEPERTDQLAAVYNENYNNLVARDYDGAYLTTPGVSTAWSWRPHQTRVISRIIQSGNTYMAHAVGAGKTSAMIGAGMEMRRLGLARKPMYAVPNHMLAQFTKEFYEQYPTARIAVADERRFHTDRRKQFIANVASEDLDGVVITHSAMGMIPVSDEFQDGVVKNEIAHYRELLSQIPKDQDNRITRSRIEKQIERLEQRLSGRNNKKRDQVFTFEEMGVDFLFVDEAHLFRKLDFSTQMGNLKGISPEGSGMAWDLYVKSLYLDQQRPNRSLVLASGTPVTNTMAELYTVSRYLQRQEMAERGLSQFDAWAGAFGEPATELEQDAAGGYKPVTRFSRFVNVPELSSMVRQTMDVVTSRQLEKYVVRPKLKGGKRVMNLADKSRQLESYQLDLAARMKAIELRKGPPKKGDDIMLSVINDGRHAAIDMRLVYPDMKKDPGSKLSLLVDNVFNTWKATKRQKFHAAKDGAYTKEPVDTGPATQMIFANLGLSGKRGFSVPDYIRSELSRRGVPKDEIAFIANYKTHVAKQKLFNDMNEGKVRILIGSTAKMATGVNAQRRLYAIHNLDPLWYPSDDEQRNGRALRQGNMNPEIEINDYSTKGTYDSTMWGMMARKAKFIQGFFEGDPSLRDMDDLGEASQYEQAKAITTNDPRLIKLTELKQDLEKATRRKASFEQELYALRARRADMQSKIGYATKRVGEVQEDIAARQDITGDKFSGKVGKKTYTKRVDFGDELLAAMDKAATTDNIGHELKLAEVGGFPVIATARKRMNSSGGLFVDVDIALRRAGHFERDIHAGESAVGVTRSIEAILGGFEHDLAGYESDIAKAERFLADSATAADAKFTGDQQIRDLSKQVRALESELAAPVAQPIATDPASISSLDALFDLGKTNEEMPARAASVARVDAGLTPKARQRQADLEHMLTNLVHKLAGNRVRVQFSAGKSIDFGGPATGWGDFAANNVEGSYIPAERLIELATGNPGVMSTAFHEALHDIEAHLWTDRELDLMMRETGRLRDVVKRRFGFTDQQVAGIAGYEIRAMAFEAYAEERANGGHGGGYGIHIGIRRAFERLLGLLRAIRNGLSRMGFQNAESIFGKAYEGKFAERGSRRDAPIGLADGPVASVRTVRPRSGNLPTPQIEMPHETVRAAMRDPTLSRTERLSAAFDALMLPASRALWDKLIDVSRLQRAAELATGQATAERFDTYLAATLYPGRAGERLLDASHDLFRPIYDAMEEHGVGRDELHDYLYARHAGERNEQIRKIDPQNDAGSGMTDDEARGILDAARPRQRDFNAVAEMVDAVVAHNRDLMEREGLEHAETLMQWAEAYDHYVPLKGAEASESEMQGTPSIGAGFDVRRGESRRALGRFNRADDILTNLLDQMQRTIIRAEKNRVGKAFLRFVQKNPSPLYKIGLAEQRRQVNPSTGLVERVWVTTNADAANVLGVKIAGDTHYIKIAHEGLVTALKNVGMERLPWFGRMLAAFTRQYSAFQTARNPEFVLTNLMRDLQDAGFSLNAEQQKGFKRAFAKNLLSGRALISAVLGEVGKTDNRFGRLYDEWRLSGGKISSFGYKDIATIRREIERELTQRTESMGRKIAMQPLRLINPFTGHVVKLFEALSDITESATRLAVYAAARDVGLSKAEAGRASRDMTVDFNKQGKAGPWLKALYAFSGPQIQGTVNLARRLRRSRKMRMAAAGIAGLGFALAMWNLWAAGDDEDDKKNLYAKKPYWEREKNIIFFTPGGKDALTIPLKIPLGYALTPFWMMGENAAMALMGKITPTEALSNWIGSAAQSFNPLGGEGSVFSLHKWMEMLSPTIADPIQELARNKNWLNRNIHPDEMPWTKGTPHSEQSKLTTAPLAVQVAEWMNRASGGNTFQKGGADIYPDDLEYAWNFALGGFGKFMLNNVSMAQDKFAGVDTPIERIPFVRRFVSPINSEQGEASQYYEQSHEAGERTAAVRNAVKAERAGNNVEDAQKTIRDYGDKVGYRIGPRGGVSSEADKVFNAANKQIGALRREERDLRNDSQMDRATRAEKIKANRTEQIEIMRQARRSYREMQPNPAQ